MKIDKEKLSQQILFLRAISNEDRIGILKLIMKDELPAQHVEKLFFIEQSTASYHLNMMRKAGLLTCRKDGKKAVYAYIDGSVEDLFAKFLHDLKA